MNASPSGHCRPCRDSFLRGAWSASRKSWREGSDWARENKELSLLFCFICVAGLGALGFRLTSGGTLLHNLLLARRLFTPGAELPPGAHPLLVMSRLAALVITSATVIGVYLSLSRKQLRGEWHRAWARDHVIVCGLGRKGLQLALRHLEAGKRIIVIEADKGNKHLAELKASRAVVLIGDASSRRMLEKAHADRAAIVYALTGSEEVNVSIADTLKEVRGLGGNRHLVCFVHFTSPVTKRACQFNTLTKRFSVLEFNVFEEGARRLRLNYVAESYRPAVGAGRDEPTRPERRFLVVGSGAAAACLVRELLESYRDDWRSACEVHWVRAAASPEAADPTVILGCRYAEWLANGLTVQRVRGEELFKVVALCQTDTSVCFLLEDDDAVNLSLAECLAQRAGWADARTRIVIGTTRPEVARRLLDKRTGRAKPGWGRNGQSPARVYVFDYLDPAFAANIKSSLSSEAAASLVSEQADPEVFSDGFSLLVEGLRHPLGEVRREAIQQVMVALHRLERQWRSQAGGREGVKKKTDCAFCLLSELCAEYVEEFGLWRIAGMFLSGRRPDFPRLFDLLNLVARLIAELFDTEYFRDRIREEILPRLVSGFLQKSALRRHLVRLLGGRLVNRFYWEKEGLPCDYLEMLFFLRDVAKKEEGGEVNNEKRQHDALVKLFKSQRPCLETVEDLFPRGYSRTDGNGLLAWYLYSILPLVIQVRAEALPGAVAEEGGAEGPLAWLDEQFQQNQPQARYIVQRTLWVLAYLMPPSPLRTMARDKYRQTAERYLLENGPYLTYVHQVHGLSLWSEYWVLRRYLRWPFKKMDGLQCPGFVSGDRSVKPPRRCKVFRSWAIRHTDDRGDVVVARYDTHRLQEYLYYRFDPENALDGDGGSESEVLKLLTDLLDQNAPWEPSPGRPRDERVGVGERLCHLLDALGEVGSSYPGPALRMIRELMTRHSHLRDLPVGISQEGCASPAVVAARAIGRIHAAHPGDARELLEDLKQDVRASLERHLDISSAPRSRFEAAHLGDRVYQNIFLHDASLRMAFGVGMEQAAHAKTVGALFAAFVKAIDAALDAPKPRGTGCTPADPGSGQACGR